MEARSHSDRTGGTRLSATARTTEDSAPTRAPIAITIGVVAVLVIAFFVFVGPLRRRALVRPARLPQRAHHRVDRAASSCSSSGSSRMAVPVWASASRSRTARVRSTRSSTRSSTATSRSSSRCAASRCTASRSCSASSRASRPRPAGSSVAQLAEPHAVRQDRPAVRSRRRRSTSSSCRSTGRRRLRLRRRAALAASLVIATNYLYGAIRVSGREVASRSPRASRSP